MSLKLLKFLILITLNRFLNLSHFFRNPFIPELRVKTSDVPEQTIFWGSRERIKTRHYFVVKTHFSRGQLLKNKLYFFLQDQEKNFCTKNKIRKEYKANFFTIWPI